jgi:2-polyprenyl-3-methyl-5-hydroxy-6-metoxy-1,4-benzoquinol methylase
MLYKGIISPESIENAYEGEYASTAKSETYMSSDVTRRFFRKVLKQINSERISYRPKLLDIGTGMGTLLEEAQSLGYDPEGIELCPELADIARQKGLKVHHMNAMCLNEPEKYDVITMMDIIEHIPHPVALLRVLHRNLKPGGKLVVYTPNHRGAIVILAKLMAKIGMNFAIHEIFGGNHVCFFDDHTLPAALHSVGFKMRYLWKFPYDPNRPGQKVSLVNLAIVTAVEWLGRPFGLVFRMVAYAQK